MKQPLYRAKRIDNNEWVYGYYVYDSRDKAHLIVIYTERGEIQYRVIPETVGMCWGDDLNNKKVFTGDIMSDVSGPVAYYEVRQLEGMPYPVLVDIAEKYNSIALTEMYTMEKEGNRWDNPELLT